MGRSSKDSHQNSKFKEILKAIFQFSVEHSIFHLEFMSVVAELLLFKPFHHITQDLGWRQDKKHIHFNCFLTRTKGAR